MPRKISAFVLTLVLCCLAGTAVTTQAAEREPRHLSFDERVEAQRAIERVYHRHQIGATKPFEEAVPREVLERKVRTYLKQSAALEEYWNTPVTAAMLRAELDRMIRRSPMPERLREIFAALGDDPFLIQETFVRSALVDRLSRNFYAYDDRFHDGARREMENLHSHLTSEALNPEVPHPRRELLEIRSLDHQRSRLRRVLPQREENDPGIPRRRAPDTSRGRSITLDPNEFARWRSELPDQIGEIGPIEEDREGFACRGLLEADAEHFRLLVYSTPKETWDVWWLRIEENLEPMSVAPAAAETGPLAETSESTWWTLPDDTWDHGALDDMPNPRAYHTSVWTGTEMIVWGGTTSYGVHSGTGSRYDPATDTWTEIATAEAPIGRYGHTAVWTGSEMIVWGGAADASGGRYDPVTDTWSPTPTVDAPSGRGRHTAVWTGSEMIVWGGWDGSQFLATGGRYDPITDTWILESPLAAPSGRIWHRAVWTGSEMIVWGGLESSFEFTDTGGRYDPVANIWTPTSTLNAPRGRGLHAAVWTGSEMIVWGGQFLWDCIDWICVTSTGGRYDPATNTWTPTSMTNPPSWRVLHTGVWTGSELVVWGGSSTVVRLDTGGRYDPATDTWTPTSRGEAPSARGWHVSVWTGNEMIVWGGSDGSTGGRYDLTIDT
jgi:N-acetylneuraminic acid mutarotase